MENRKHKPNPAQYLEFMEYVGTLKHLKRTGWIISNVPEPTETVASHMYRMAILSMITDQNDGIDRSKCVQMALIHDLPECIVGDITPHCGIPVERKHQIEKDAMGILCHLIPTSNATYISSLYEEYEKQETPEAKLVKEFDRLDMILQAYEYEKRGNFKSFDVKCSDGGRGDASTNEESENSFNLEEYFKSCEGKFSNPFVLSIVDEIKKKRAEFHNNE